jgi:hypothetical protein
MNTTQARIGCATCAPEEATVTVSLHSGTTGRGIFNLRFWIGLRVILILDKLTSGGQHPRRYEVVGFDFSNKVPTTEVVGVEVLRVNQNRGTVKGSLFSTSGLHLRRDNFYIGRDASIRVIHLTPRHLMLPKNLTVLGSIETNATVNFFDIES